MPIRIKSDVTKDTLPFDTIMECTLLLRTLMRAVEPIAVIVVVAKMMVVVLVVVVVIVVMVKVLI